MTERELRQCPICGDMVEIDVDVILTACPSCRDEDIERWTRFLRGSDRLSDDLDRVPFEAQTQQRRTDWTALIVCVIAVCVVVVGVYACVWLAAKVIG
jgi:predicted RNA-binding Zn-ribbon protein involved in translation (DUF1610 family)